MNKSTNSYQSLYKLYNGLIRKNIAYYYDLSNKKSFSKIKTIFWCDNPTKFIKEYFGEGNKNEIIGSSINLLWENSKTKIRIAHIISTYFLGLLFYFNNKNIQDAIIKMCAKIEEKIPEFDQDSQTNMFLYIWFLTCLYHDVGYCFENNLNNYIDQYEDAVKKCEVPITDWVPKKLKKLCTKYLKMREDEKNALNKKSLDHGISGGILLYLKFKELTEKFQKDNITANRENIFKHNNLIWGTDIVDNYGANAAWAIICHNMWLCDPDDKETKKKYKKYKLNQLITKEQLIKLEKHPLLHLLCLVDTIEPVKTIIHYSRKNILDILKQIEVKFYNNSISIKNHPKLNLGLEFIGINSSRKNYKSIVKIKI